jgi:GntR family transcriptional repressor for pyruvate dehydrogenase complex
MSVLRRVKLYEQVSERLERRIREQDIAPGEELPSERELMKEYGVGRPAVREALFHLQKMGLLELKAGARARVAAPDARAVVGSLAGSARYLLSAPDGMRHFQEARMFFVRAGPSITARREADIAALRARRHNGGRSATSAVQADRRGVSMSIATIRAPSTRPCMRRSSMADGTAPITQLSGQNRIACGAHAAIFAASRRASRARRGSDARTSRTVAAALLAVQGVDVGFVIMVDFTVKPGSMTAFERWSMPMPGLLPRSRLCASTCWPGGDAQVVLYEIYGNRAASMRISRRPVRPSTATALAM